MRRESNIRMPSVLLEPAERLKTLATTLNFKSAVCPPTEISCCFGTGSEPWWSSSVCLFVCRYGGARALSECWWGLLMLGDNVAGVELVEGLSVGIK